MICNKKQFQKQRHERICELGKKGLEPPIVAERLRISKRQVIDVYRANNLEHLIRTKSP